MIAAATTEKTFMAAIRHVAIRVSDLDETAHRRQSRS
jgi:hypothetical protein